MDVMMFCESSNNIKNFFFFFFLRISYHKLEYLNEAHIDSLNEIVPYIITKSGMSLQF